MLEYDVLQYTRTIKYGDEEALPNLKRELLALANEGWRLVSTANASDGTLLLFVARGGV